MIRVKFKIACAFFMGFTIMAALPGFANAQSSGTSVQQSNTVTTCDNDPQCMTGNPDGTGATRLNAHDRVLIEAQEAGSPPPPLICRAVLNNSNQDVFVPWRTPDEWTSFINTTAAATSKAVSTSMGAISLGQCCPPLNATVCGKPVYYSGSSTAVPLGYRPLGVLAGNTTPAANWGAETDIYGPISAPPPLDYQVTYVCTNGSWVKTREIGSCTPTNGACSAMDGQYTPTFPTDPSTFTSLLCASGSVFDATVGLQVTATGWSWQCDGTQGMTNATCSAYKNPPVNGECGNLNTYGNYVGTMYTVADLLNVQSTNPVLICAQGTWAGSFNDNNNTNRFITWTCLGQNGGSNSSTCGVPASVVNGTCGSDNNQTYITQTNNPPTAGLCGKSGETAQNLTFTGSAWTWTCSGLGAGSPSPQCAAYYNPNQQNGACGSDAGRYFADGTLSPTDPNLCSVGVPIWFGTNPGQTAYWGWDCQGVSGGSNTWCSAYDIPPVNGQCGADNGTTENSLTANDPNLCAAGNVSSFAQSNGQWSWSCGSGGGTTAWCSASESPSLADAVCGGAASTLSPTAPTTSLCTYGNASGMSENTNGTQWTWICTSLDGSRQTGCSATVQQPTQDGVCGAANGTAIPNTPNYNLCGVGTPSPISGTGPWTWTCGGTGGGNASSVCTAFLCNACSGTTTRLQSASRTGTVGSCTISGIANWTEVDSLIPGAASAETIAWVDTLGSFNENVQPTAAPWPNYCPPCFLQAQGVQNASTTITGLSGSCGGYSVGQVIPAN